MPDQRPHGSSAPVLVSVGPAVRAALATLLESYVFAQDLDRNPWDFAVETGHLQKQGLTDNQLRWLLGKGYVEHAVETTPACGKCRRFRRSGQGAFSRKSCVILTTRGLVIARDLRHETCRPQWDADRRELRWREEVVKRFRQPAHSQEFVLAAFEEEGWPLRIDDPLPPQVGQDQRQRLHDTINNLNRYQRRPLLRFSGDGHGQGICWRLLAACDTGATPELHQRHS